MSRSLSFLSLHLSLMFFILPRSILEPIITCCSIPDCRRRRRRRGREVFLGINIPELSAINHFIPILFFFFFGCFSASVESGVIFLLVMKLREIQFTVNHMTCTYINMTWDRTQTVRNDWKYMLMHGNT